MFQNSIVFYITKIIILFTIVRYDVSNKSAMYKNIVGTKHFLVGTINNLPTFSS